jgi:hypothetical protein
VTCFVLFARGEGDLFLVDGLNFFVCHRCRFVELSRNVLRYKTDSL